MIQQVQTPNGLTISVNIEKGWAYLPQHIDNVFSHFRVLDSVANFICCGCEFLVCKDKKVYTLLEASTGIVFLREKEDFNRFLEMSVRKAASYGAFFILDELLDRVELPYKSIELANRSYVPLEIQSLWFQL